MHNTKQLTKDQALRAALRYADLPCDQALCLDSRLEDGLWHMLVRTAYLRYEFYVDAVSGELLGIDTQPLPYPEMLRFAEGEGLPPLAA